jgi:hypothetical protein
MSHKKRRKISYFRVILQGGLPDTVAHPRTTHLGRVWFGFFLNSFSEKLAVGKSWWLEFRCLVRQLCRKAVR